MPHQLPQLLDSLYTFCDMISAAVWPPFIAALCIGVPSVILYTGQLCVILANWKHFQSSYFVIFTLRGGICIANYFFSYIAHRLGRVGLFESVLRALPSIVLALGPFTMYYSFHLENLTTALLLLNRLSSVLFPLRYERLWRVFLPIAFVLTVVLPLPFTATVFWLEWFVEMDYERTPSAGNNYTFTLNNNVPKDFMLPRWSFTTICANSGIVFLAISLLLNLVTLWAFVRRSKTATAVVVTNENSQQQRIEKKLTIYTLITFFGQFLLSLYMILMRIRYFEPDHDNQERIYLAIFNQYGWVTDFCTIALPSWSLLWANKKSRELLFDKFFLHKIGIGTNTTAVPIAALGMNSWAPRTRTWASRRVSDRPTTVMVVAALNQPI